MRGELTEIRVFILRFMHSLRLGSPPEWLGARPAAAIAAAVESWRGDPVAPIVLLCFADLAL